MSGKASDHLANERTFLAWVRTALGLIGLGFVLARMGLFLRQIAVAAPAGGLSGLNSGRALHSGQEFLITGVVFLGIGTAACSWAGWLYGRNRRAIDADRYEPATRTVAVLTSAVVFGGLVIIGLVFWRVMGEG